MSTRTFVATAFYEKTLTPQGAHKFSEIFGSIEDPTVFSRHLRGNRKIVYICFQKFDP